MAADQKPDPQKRQGKVPTAPHVDSPPQRKPAEPAESEGLGIDPHPRPGHVPRPPQAEPPEKN